MALSITADTALLIIDVQQGLDDPRMGQRNNPNAEQNMAALLAAWRTTQRPVIHIQHASTEANSPLRPELPGFAIKTEVLPQSGEPLFVKNVNSAFIGTDLEDYLHGREIKELVIVGLTTGHCVSTSVRMAANLGFKVLLVGDATADFDRTGPDGKHWSGEEMHDMQLTCLDGEFCKVVWTNDLLSTIGD